MSIPFRYSHKVTWNIDYIQVLDFLKATFLGFIDEYVLLLELTNSVVDPPQLWRGDGSEK